MQYITYSTPAPAAAVPHIAMNYALTPPAAKLSNGHCISLAAHNATAAQVQGCPNKIFPGWHFYVFFGFIRCNLDGFRTDS